jgi:hypothetical protein
MLLLLPNHCNPSLSSLDLNGQSDGGAMRTTEAPLRSKQFLIVDEASVAVAARKSESKEAHLFGMANANPQVHFERWRFVFPG